MSEQEVGRVINFFNRLSVAAIEITNGTISVGDTLIIYGYYTETEIKVNHMEIDRKPVRSASKGQSVGIWAPNRLRKGEIVCKVINTGQDPGNDNKSHSYFA